MPEAEDIATRCQQAAALAAADLLDDAEQAFTAILADQPANAAAREGLAALQADLQAKNTAMARHRQGALADARRGYEAILARRPRYPEILNNLGVLLLQAGDPAGAAEVLRRAVAAKPGLASASSNLGAALKRQGRLPEAIAAYRRAIAAAPRMADAHYNLGHALVELQRLPEALEAYAAALGCDPGHRGARCSSIHQRRHLCDWRRFAEDAADLRALIDEGVAEVTPFDAMIFFDDPALQGASASRMSARQCFGIAPMPPRQPERRERLRVGYLSSDFRAHPVSWLLTETIEQHDRSRIECFAYAHGRSGADSPERARLQAAFEHFRDIDRLGMEDAAQAIRADGIDILVDLNGHTLGARSGILARRPAPVQVSWLGFPGPMNGAEIDYLIGDAIATPAALQAHTRERIVQLPLCFQPGYRRIAGEPPHIRRADCGLPESGVVLCCFNNSWKITPAFFAVWMHLLQEIPDAVLWLLESSTEVRENLRREASARGVDPARLIFAPRAPLPVYFARLGLADLFLDTLPYNAGTTARDALWAGLPVLSVTGKAFAGRMAASLLHAAGLPELAVASLADYAARAKQLVREPGLQAELRRRVAAVKQGPLFDTAGFARDLEAAFSVMQRRALAGEPPAAFAIRRREATQNR